MRPPGLSARVRRVFRAGSELAFHKDPVGAPVGWLLRLDGSYMRRARIKDLAPSEFGGELQPQAPLAFVIRPTWVRMDSGARVQVARYQRFFVPGDALDLTTASRMLRVAGGWLPRSAVRLVLPRNRPPKVPSSARWVYVDRSEYVLSAYEGDRMVFATLVSIGKSRTPTPARLYRIYYKNLRDNMHGEPEDPYVVEEVPFGMYFLHGMSLHGTYWHDSFGSPASHGCVNLSLRDAEWLFRWAPPRLPTGWHAVFPRAANWTALWVLIR